MTDPRKKYYSDILLAISLIEEFTADVKTFEQYSDDVKTRSAVERQLVIVGEAVSKLNKIDDSGLKHAQPIISFRNRLVHAYDSIDNSIVWLILKRHLSLLKEEIKAKV